MPLAATSLAVRRGKQGERDAIMAVNIEYCKTGRMTRLPPSKRERAGREGALTRLCSQITRHWLHQYVSMITHVSSHLGEGGFVADQLKREEGGVVVVDEVA